MVTDAVLYRLSRPDAAVTLVPDDSESETRTARIAELRARKDQAADAFAAGDIDAAQLTRISATLGGQVEQLEAQRRRSSGKPASYAMAGPDADARWAEASLEQRRTIIGELLDVRIMRARRGARTFDPASVRLTRKV